MSHSQHIGTKHHNSASPFFKSPLTIFCGHQATRIENINKPLLFPVTMKLASRGEIEMPRTCNHAHQKMPGKTNSHGFESYCTTQPHKDKRKTNGNPASSYKNIT